MSWQLILPIFWDVNVPSAWLGHTPPSVPTNFELYLVDSPLVTMIFDWYTQSAFISQQRVYPMKLLVVFFSMYADVIQGFQCDAWIWIKKKGDKS